MFIKIINNKKMSLGIHLNNCYKWNEFLLKRNQLKLKCLDYNISFEEFISIGEKGLDIKYIIGGEKEGTVFTQYIYSEDNLADVLNDFMKIIIKRMIKDKNF